MDDALAAFKAEATACLGSHRLRDLVQLLQGSRAKFSAPPSLHAQFAYHCGVLYQAELGRGDAAREHYLEAIKCIEEMAAAEQTALSSLLADAYENMAALSLSYPEFYDWAEKTKKVRPDSPIADSSGHGKAVAKADEEARPWRFLMIMAAMQARETNDLGRMVSLCQLMLLNKTKLRMNDNGGTDWHGAVMTFGEGARTLFAYHGHGMELEQRRVDLPQLLPLLEGVVGLLEQYLAEHPSDQKVVELRDELRPLAEGKMPGAEGKMPGADAPAPRGCATALFILTMLGLTLWYLLK